MIVTELKVVYCVSCGCALHYERRDGAYVLVHVRGECDHRGKVFKVKTTELEEIVSIEIAPV